MKDYKALIDVAMGRAKADAVITGAKVLNVFTKEFENLDIAICGDYIAALGKRGSYAGEIEIDYSDKYIVPGFIDAHMHIESSMLLPSELMNIILPFGTTTIIADPHEIANVLGSDGVEFMSKKAELANGNVKLMVPSCVPATDFESTGGEITSIEVKKLLDLPNVHGLAEMMNYPGVMCADSEVIKKIQAANGRHIDGHAPLVTGMGLQAYGLTGIKTDHECRTFEEAKEKIRLGMWTLLREGSSARDLENIVPEVVKANFPFDRFAICTDDKNAMDIVAEGHIDHAIRTCINLGVKPETAYCLATLHTAECFGLSELGSVSAGKLADFVVLDDYQKVAIHEVFTHGKKVSTLSPPTDDKKEHFMSKNKTLMFRAQNSVHVKSIKESMFMFGQNDEDMTSVDRHILKIIPGILNSENALYPKDTIKDAYDSGKLCKVAVVERHRKTGNSALALLEGYGLNDGAIATTIGHDSHNIICVGKQSSDMKLAVEHLADIQGGICIVKNGTVLASLNLNIAGLMSSKPATELIEELKDLQKHVASLGIYEHVEPFITMSFLALPVIPELRITDKGLFDVLKWDWVNE